MDSEVELTAHDYGVGLPSELVEEGEGDGVDFVVYVKALNSIRGRNFLYKINRSLPFDVFPVILHYDVYKVVDRSLLHVSSDQYDAKRTCYHSHPVLGLRNSASYSLVRCCTTFFRRDFLEDSGT